MYFLRICGSRRIVISSVFSRTPADAALPTAPPTASTVLDIGRADAARFGLNSLAQRRLVLRAGHQLCNDLFVRRCCARWIFRNRLYTLFASDQFDFTPAERPVQIAFANSVFSHLSLNSIFTALLQLQNACPTGVLYATFFALEQGRPGLPIRATNGGVSLRPFTIRIPTTPLPLLQDLARQAGFRLDVVDDFGHPTQTMGRFRQGGGAGPADMRIGLLATLRDEIQALPRFSEGLVLEADSRVSICSAVFTRTTPAMTP